jgi:hypothetical protein
MKIAPTAVGAEPKKLALLGAILVAGGAIYWFQNRSDNPTVSASVTPPPAIPAIKQLPEALPEPKPSMKTADAVSPVPQRHLPGSGGGGNSVMEDFHPSMKVKDDLDVSKIDPRIRLDLLAKVRAVPMEGGSSSLFEFSKAPEPPAPKVDPIKPAAVPVPPPVAGPAKTPPKEAGPPPPAPIPFTYYGYGKTSDGQLEGFFREGDAKADPTTSEIHAAREGDTIKSRYKIVRIGIKSAVVEDTTNHNEQTLRLLEEAQ